MSRPSAWVSKSGKRPPWMRLWTRAEMNTVLPARERPVTPSRTVGVPPPVATSSTLSKTMRASSVIAVKFGSGI